MVAAGLLVAAPAVTVERSAALAQTIPLEAADVPPRTLAGGAAVIIVGLLVLLYLHRRRVYILYWIGGWSCFAAGMFALNGGNGRALTAFLYGVSQFMTIASSAFFVFAADAYRSHARLRARQLSFLLPVAVWCLAAPVVLGAGYVFVPGHILAGIVLAVAGGAHLLILRDARLLGAGVVGLTLTLISLTHFWVAASRRLDVFADAFLIQIALFFVIALGMQLMAFEDMTSELRQTNSRLETAQSELKQMVVTDAMTGCRNRRFFDEVIPHELSNRRRYTLPLSLLFVDVDRFKSINDTLGHTTGDRVLREVAGFLMRHTRGADYVFRWGGDEFLLLLSCREEEARRRGEELQAAFATSSTAADLPAGVGLSFGCAEVPADADSIVDALKLADERMYANKRRLDAPGARAV